MKKKTMLSWVGIFAIISVLSTNSYSQYDKINPKKFKDQLEEGSKLIGSDEDLTLERTVDKTFIFKYYNPTTKQLLERVTYFDRALTIKEGPAAKYNNEGLVILQGNYKENYRHGPWIENYNTGAPKSRGSYDSGDKTGKWEYFNFNGELSKEEVWENGELLSEKQLAPTDEESFVYDMSDTLLTTKPLFIKCNEGKGEK
ncbi:MAG: hypothetical protein KDC24_15020, partial [Saprospiraceae bacterium]|nr:hypothetical protein [Saprospiraceae bacterium]